MTARATEKHAQLLAQVMSLQVRRDELVAAIAKSHDDERIERESSIEAQPSRLSNWKGALSQLTKLERARKSAEVEVAGIVKELEAAANVLERLKEQVTAEQAETVAREKAVLDAEEVALLQKMTDHCEQWLVAWQEMASFYARRQQATFLQGVSSGDASVEQAISEARGPFLEPQPVDFLAMVEAVYEHCCDPHGAGVRDGRPTSLGQATCQNWLEGTRDLRAFEVFAPVPPNSRPRFASRVNTSAYRGDGGPTFGTPGGNGAPVVEWRTAKAW